MAEYITKQNIADALFSDGHMDDVVFSANDICRIVDDIPAADVRPVVRCRDCIWYHPAHVLLNDGTERHYNESDGDGLIRGLVSCDVGINVGGQCEYEKYGGYDVDKTVFRSPDDFCSRGNCGADMRGDDHAG